MTYIIITIIILALTEITILPFIGRYTDDKEQ